MKLPFIPDDPRVIDSTGALELQGIPKRLLVIGGGIIGLEMACVYDALGAKVTIVELMDQIIPGADKDIVKPLHKRIEGRYEAIHLKAKVTGGQGARHRARGGDGGAERRLHRRVRPGAGRGRPPAERQADRGRGGGGARRRARVHPGRRADADQRPPYLRDRRRGGTADARAQGGARGQGGGRGGGRDRTGCSTRG